MSFIDRTKEFFGLQPMDMDHDDAYYEDDARYATAGSAAYQPRPSYERASAEPEFAPTIVPISLTTYNDAPKIGEPFRDGDAVVFELTDAEKSAAKRFIDFAAGLCFALRGRMVDLTKGLDTDRRVFAIVPERANISTLELERAAQLR